MSRALRMKALIGEMQAPPTLDLDDPALPPDRMEALLRVTAEVGADAIGTMSLEELLQHFDDVMALWVWRWLGAGRDGRGIFGRLAPCFPRTSQPLAKPIPPPLARDTVPAGVKVGSIARLPVQLCRSRR